MARLGNVTMDMEVTVKLKSVEVIKGWDSDLVVAHLNGLPILVDFAQKMLESDDGTTRVAAKAAFDDWLEWHS